MKRLITGGVLFLGAVSGCVSVDQGPETGGPRPNYGRSFGPPAVPGVQGPYGAPVPMAAPYSMNPPGNPYTAQQMMQRSVPMSAVQMNPAGSPVGGLPGMPPMPVPPGGLLSPPGVPGMPGAPPGMPGMPGMPGGNPFQRTGGVGPMPGSVMPANLPPGTAMPGGVTQAQFANSSPVGPLFPAQRTQVQFARPGGMKVYWSTQGKDGKPVYSETPLETPGRYNFAQGAIYRLKLTRIPGRPGLELYPTLEVVPTGPKTNEFLAHNSVPIEFSDDDFKQVVDRNYIVKVIYLPDPQFQDVAGAGPDEIVSSRLEPGQDPIQEALRRGSILLVLRIGNIDQGLQASPPLTAPVPGAQPAAPMMPGPGGGVPPLFQVPINEGPLLPGPGGAMPTAPLNLPPLPPGPGVGPGPLNLPVPPGLQTPPGLPQPLAPKKGEAEKPAPKAKDTEKPAVKKLSGAPNPNPLVVPAGAAQDELKAPMLPPLPDMPAPPSTTTGAAPALPSTPQRPDLPPVPIVPMTPKGS